LDRSPDAAHTLSRSLASHREYGKARSRDQVVDDRTSSIEFQLPPRLPEITVSGRTVSPDGTPIQGVSLFLHDVDAIVGFSDISIRTSDQHVVSGTGMTLKWLRRAAEWEGFRLAHCRCEVSPSPERPATPFTE